MTISTTASRISYNGNGATTAFSFPYRFLTNADLTVIKVAADGTETTLVLNTDYTVAGADEDAGGTVTIGTAPASGTRVVIFREIDITQEVDYITGDAFPAETHERAIDRLTMIAQQHQDAIDRSAKLSETSTADADTLIANINALAAIEDDVSDVAAIVSDVSDVAAIDANVTTVAGIAANVTTVAGIAANVTSVAGNATNINTVAGNNSNVTTVAGVSSAVTTVAGISSAVSTVAADGTDIGVVAGISADVQAVANIAADVSAVENIAANVTTVAGIAANVTTVAGISANVTTVAGNTTNINTVAGISANVTTVAGISADVTAVAADATDIGTVATNIADVNTVATDIADINTCADNMAAILDAPAQASAAAASAAAAAASLDNFDDRYLGSKDTAPTLDNDGNALVAGALYFNTGVSVADDKGMWIYDGGTWIQASAASQAILVRYKYVATAAQTTFTGTDANGLTLSYTAGSIIVTLNGVVMDAADYTATTGTSVVLGAAASLNDELGVVSFATFDVADTYTQAQVDAFAVKLTGDQNIAGAKKFTGSVIVGRVNSSDEGGQIDLCRSSDDASAWAVDVYGSTSTPSLRFVDNVASATRMTIDGSGNVGIGTSSPTNLLHVSTTNAGANNFNLRLMNLGTTVSTAVSALLTNKDAGNNNISSAITSTTTDATSSSGGTALSFSTTYLGGLTERMRIDSSGNLQFNSGYGSVATAYGCRAWVNFNGTGTVAIRASGNVSSITDGGVGLYTVNFTTAMPDVNYAMKAICGGNGSDYRTMVSMNDGTQAVGSIQMRLVNTASGQVDSSTVMVSVHR